MKKFKSTIKLLKKILNDPNCQRMNKAIVVGYLGELIIKNKLEKEGYKVTHRGNHGKYDLEFFKNEVLYRIDVKTSTFKDEHKWGHKYWGWPLVISTKDLTCSHFVCLALDEKYNEKAMYIISQKKVKFFSKALGQFKSVKHGFGLFPGKIPKILDKRWYKFMKKSKNLLDKGIIIKLTKGVKLSKEIR